MSSTSLSNQIPTVLKLEVDGSNWSTYSERVMNYLTSKGLKRHVLGTAQKPVKLVEKNRDYYKLNATSPLNDDELEKHKKDQDEYEQKQASVHKVFYRSINKSTFIQVKNEMDAAAIWKKIMSIHADRGSMFKTNLLTQLQTNRYIKGESMCEYLAKIVKIKGRQVEMSYSLSYESFALYICMSISLAPNFQSLITILNALAHKTGGKLMSKSLIWHLNKEANAVALEETINKSNEAMLAATTNQC